MYFKAAEPQEENSVSLHFKAVEAPEKNMAIALERLRFYAHQSGGAAKKTAKQKRLKEKL